MRGICVDSFNTSGGNVSFSSMLVTAIGDCLVNSGKFSESDCEAIQGALQFSCPENPGIHQVSKLVQSKKKGFSDESSNLWGLQGKFVKSLLHRDEFAEVSLPYLESVIGKVKENGERGRQRARENEFLKLNIVLYTMGTWLKDSIGSIRKELEHDFQKPELTKAELAKNVQAFCKTIREAKSANYDLKWPRLVVEGHRNGDFQKKDWFLDLFDLAVRCAPIKFEKQNLEMEFLKKRAKAIARTNIIRDKKSFYSLRRFIEEEMYKGQYLSLSTTIYSPLQYLFEKKYSSNTKWTRQQINERVSKLEELMQLYKRYYDVMVVMKSVEDIGAYEITEATKKLSNQIYWTIKQQATGSLVCETDMQTFMTFIKSFGGRYSETDSIESFDSYFQPDSAAPSAKLEFHEIRENIEEVDTKFSNNFGWTNLRNSETPRPSLVKRCTNRIAVWLKLILYTALVELVNSKAFLRANYYKGHPTNG